MFDKFQYFVIFLCPREMPDHATLLFYIPQKSGKYDKLEISIYFTVELKNEKKSVKEM